MKLSLLTSLALGATFATSACSFHTEDSTTTQVPLASPGVPTSAIWPSMSAQSDGTNLSVFTALLGRGSFLSVGGSDSLTAAFGGGPEVLLTLQPGGASDSPHYIAEALSPKDATDVVVRFHRAGGEVDTVSMHVPAAFDLDGLLPQSLKRSTPMTVHLLQTPPAGSQLEVLVVGSCIQDFTSGKLEASTITNDTITTALSYVKEQDGAPSSCQVTVKVQISNAGSFTGPFDPNTTDANSLVGIQERRFNAQWSSTL